jgi:heptose-I-phosphate ethanolaminephosphotransferase
MYKNSVKIAFVFLLPIILFFLFECFSGDIGIERFYNVIENLLFATVLIIMSYFIKSQKYKSLYLKSAIILFVICLYLETFYFYHFGGVFSVSSMFVLFETNNTEAMEFLIAYFNSFIIFLTVFTLVLIIWSFRRFNDGIKSLKVTKGLKLKLILIVFSILLFLKLTKLIIYNVPYLAVRTPISYFQEMQKFKAYGIENAMGNFTNVSRKNKVHDKELYIIVIGESTSRAHFQLNNGYYRETTPLLKSIKDEILVLNDVISPHAYTIGALSKGLTLGNAENPDGKYQGSILQLLNQAGFKTYWLSNQRPIGISDTQVTKIAKGADTSIFLNMNHTSEKTPYDEVLLKELNRIVLEDGDKKVVFLHMIGAHFYYEMRYPEKFNIFKDTPKTQFKRPEVYETINAYDNAMRYTDSILSEVVKISKKQEAQSFMLYFSDHGQEVYDEINFFGQTIDQMVTKNMYDIPMFLWMSDSYRLNNELADNSDKKYMTDDILHSIADLCGVTSKETDSTRSIFNTSFKERKRIIKNNLDYDTHFKNKP